MNVILFVVFLGSAGPLAFSSGFADMKSCLEARNAVPESVKENNADSERPRIEAYAAVCVRPTKVPKGTGV